jgi:polyhydroxybutyrate depolymerase
MRSLGCACLFVAACGSAAAPATSTTPATPPGAARALLLARPYDLHVPPGYDAARPAPLVVVLHGYTLDGKMQDAYFRMSEVGDREGFLVARPDGTKDSGGNRFWNATDACCDFGGTHVDDVAYIGAMLDDIASKYRVDPKRVYLVGHSNGAFFANRLACDLAPRIAAIATLAGAGWLDPSRCTPAAKVSVLAISGDDDQLVHFDGGALDDAVLAGLAKEAEITLPSPLVPGARTYPSQRANVAFWAKADGCTGALAPTGTIDLDAELAGAETRQEAYGGCAGAAVELWTAHGGGHVLQLAPAPASPAFADAVWAFFAAHPRS